MLNLSGVSPHIVACTYASLILKAGEEAPTVYAHVCERKASKCADRSVEIAGNESLDYCISAEHWQIIEAKWDWQDPSKLKERLIEEKQPQWPANLIHYFALLVSMIQI